MDNDKIYSSKKYLLDFLCIRDNFLYSDFSNKYKEKTIPKKNGGERKIKPPIFGLKIIQRKILDTILSRKSQLPCVYGLLKEKDILSNAKTHQKYANKQLLALDIRDFFPNVSKKQVLKTFNKLGFNRENSSILTKICTIDNSLPQGSPTSPYLASFACDKLDKNIYSYCKKRNFLYTRYFDDINISGKNISDKDIDYFEKCISKNGFDSNQTKKKFFTENEEKIVNSILIKDSMLSVTDKYKEEIKSAYRKFVIDNNLKNQRKFEGKFSFYLHVNRREALLFLGKLKKEKF